MDSSVGPEFWYCFLSRGHCCLISTLALQVSVCGQTGLTQCFRLEPLLPLSCYSTLIKLLSHTPIGVGGRSSWFEVEEQRSLI